MALNVVGDSGAELAAGEAGDIFVQSAAASSLAYIGLEEARGDFGGRFVTVGDIGSLDEEGFLFLCDRRRDMIIVRERQHISRGDRGGPDPAAIQSALTARLSRFKVPRIVQIVDDLPREDSGKIFDRKLREPCWADVGRTI